MTKRDEFVPARNLKKGDELLQSDGRYGIIETVEIEYISTPEATYNFEVAEYHTYYVGSGILTHNKCNDILNFESREQLELHFNRHASQFRGMYSDADEYLIGANGVINNGMYNVRLNGYTMFYRINSKGQSLYHFVGLKNAGTNISTYFPRVL